MRLACIVSLMLAACGAAVPAPPPGVRPAENPGDLTDDDVTDLRGAGIDPASLRCNGRQVWNPRLRAEAKATANEALVGLEGLGVTVAADKVDAARRLLTEAIQWRMVRTTLIDGNFNNLGAVPLSGLRTADGKPLLLFRTGFTPAPDAAGSCLRSLVSAGGVRHVTNLYAGVMPTADLEAEERRVVESAGGTYASARDGSEGSGNWREGLRQGEDAAAAHREAQVSVARVIRDLLQPGGKAPNGNVMVHCGGGMHRTGMVVGVIERCLNGTSAGRVADAYRRHVAWRSAADPGGFEQENLDFIAGFDCGLLSGIGKGPAPP